MKDEILALVNRLDHVSFVELGQIAGFSGDREMHSSTDPNLICWQGMSTEAIDAINSLIREKKIEMLSASYLTYLIDGCTMNLPLARRPPTAGYSKPHWLPVRLCKPGTMARELAQAKRAKKAKR